MRIAYMFLGGMIVLAVEAAFVCGAVMTVDVSARAAAKRKIESEEE